VRRTNMHIGILLAKEGVPRLHIDRVRPELAGKQSMYLNAVSLHEVTAARTPKETTPRDACSRCNGSSTFRALFSERWGVILPGMRHLFLPEEPS